MYNTDDIVNGVSTRDCFHSLLDMAYFYKEQNQEKAETYFDVIRTCLGIDFSTIYNADADILFHMDCSYDTETCFEVTYKSNEGKQSEAMHKEIDRIFDSIELMVSDGNFSKYYYIYLKSRKRILEDLIHYFEVYITMLPITNRLQAKRVIANSQIQGKQEEEIHAMMDILSNQESDKIERKINALLRTKELLETRLEEVNKKVLTPNS